MGRIKIQGISKDEETWEGSRSKGSARMKTPPPLRKGRERKAARRAAPTGGGALALALALALTHLQLRLGDVHAFNLRTMAARTTAARAVRAPRASCRRGGGRGHGGGRGLGACRRVVEQGHGLDLRVPVQTQWSFPGNSISRK